VKRLPRAFFVEKEKQMCAHRKQITSSRPDSPAAAPRLDKWKVIGPGGGGAQYFPTISPHDPDKVFVRCDMTGAYTSDDGGNSWRMLNLRGVVHFFAFDPVDPDTVYAQTIGLWRSTDSGGTWKLIYPDPSMVERIVFVGDHAAERIILRGERDRMPADFKGNLQAMANYTRRVVSALAVDPSHSRTLYAAMTSRGRTSFCVSKNWGKTWEEDCPLPVGAQKIYVDPASPVARRTIYVVGENRVSVRESGKWTHHKSPAGVKSFFDVSAGFVGGGGVPIIYGIADARWRGKSLSGGIFVSQNGGRTWSKANADLVRQTHLPSPDPATRGVAACLSDGRVAYIGVKNWRFGPGRKDVCFGTAKTADAGKTWRIVVRETGDKPASNVKDAWTTERFGPLWGDAPRYLGVAPGDPDICYTTDDGRTMRTTDGGKTWRGVYSKKVAGGWTTTGLDVTTCYGVHFDPFDSKRVFISYTDIGVFASENGGTTWKSVTASGVPHPWINTTYWMVFDPKVKGRAWAVMTGFHDLPRPKMWRNRGVAHYNGGVCASDDGGLTWRRSTRGMPETAPTHILLDPDSPADARTLYVTGYGTGVWKSINGGATWSLKNKGIEGKEPFAWRLVRDPRGALYLIVARRSDDGGFGDARDGAIYRSTDGAESWERVSLPHGVNGPNGLAIDPENPDRLYLATWGRASFNGDVDGGIWISENAGRTWRNVLDRYQHVYDITVDPKRPNVLYATGFFSSVLRSDNKGNTWRRLKGFNFKWGHRVTPDPRNGRMIYVATFGGSVWYGPAQGDPDAADDIATAVAKLK
jgi:photosystem II stability/assembly factor-like uncharacterized protein